MSKYDNILNYNYVMKHERMSLTSRAFQFAPFSALTGYSELIKEKGRETTIKKEITEDNKEILDYKLKIINNKINLRPQVEITYFIKDKTKTGGSYEKITGFIKKIDCYHRLIILEDGLKIKIDNIIEIDSFDVNFDDITL